VLTRVMMMRVRSLLRFVPQIEPMSELVENGSKSTVIGILGAV